MEDRREVPILRMPYGEVPITHLSAGIRRVLSIAYVTVWLARERRIAAELAGGAGDESLVVVFDEVEAHLHPKWQRLILPALLDVVGGESDLFAGSPGVQILAATHSPLVLASLEPHLAEPYDAAFAFDLTAGHVHLDRLDWRPRGDAAQWLTSEAFGLDTARSREAEDAIRQAESVFSRPDLPLEERGAAHRRLREVLGDTDPYWVRWVAQARRAGIQP